MVMYNEDSPAGLMQAHAVGAFAHGYYQEPFKKARERYRRAKDELDFAIAERDKHRIDKANREFIEAANELTHQQKLEDELADKRTKIASKYWRMMLNDGDWAIEAPYHILKRISLEEADKWVSEIQKQFEIELQEHRYYWTQRGKFEVPPFNLMAPHAKVMMMYEFRQAYFEVYHQEGE